MNKLQTKNLTFEINGEANAVSIQLCGADAGRAGSDFWRLILDDGLRTEIPVFSHAQSGRASEENGVITVFYDKLVSDYGDTYDIALEIKISKKGELLAFDPTVTNSHAGVRVNECFCPMIDVEQVVGNKDEDILYMPNGLGEKAENPWKKLTGLNAQYYYHDQHEVVWHLHYPQASMSWMGVQSADKFLYVAKYDEQIRCCFLSVRQKIHSDPKNMVLSIDHFPMVRQGESVAFPGGVVGLLDGDWRAGADLYREYAFASYYKIPEKADWVKSMTGWQRIIMRSQYGEDYYKADDLPRLYEIGKKYGINTLFLFAWWKGGMDVGYPYYEEPYEGAYEDLKRNIRKVREMGGRVILECNCHFLDPKSDFYKQYGDEVKIIDINGNEVRPAFVYPGYGEFRTKYGARQFPVSCSCTQRWRDQVLSQFELMNSIDADCLFADCYGSAPTQPCFNDKHEHGARVDLEWTGKRKFFEKAESYCKEQGKVLACEIVTDIAASYNQFIHSLFNADYATDGAIFPQMFRYTFPEVIATNRGVRCSEGDYANQLRFAFLMGMRFDAELFVCRTHLDDDPDYAAVIGECTAYMEKYAEFMLRGRFTVRDTGKLPCFIKRAEYISEDGARLLTVLLNCSDKNTEACGQTLEPGKLTFVITENN